MPLLTTDNGQRTTDKLRRIVRVEADVVVREVTGPEGARSAPEREGQTQAELAVALEVRGHRRRVERLRRAGAVEQRLAHPEREVLLLEGHPRVAGRRDDPPP